jgi:hypothetical protein
MRFACGIATNVVHTDLVGVPMEPLADSLKAKLASLTPEQIIPRAFAIAIPQEIRDKLVDNDLYKKNPRSLRRSRHRCSIQ